MESASAQARERVDIEKGKNVKSDSRAIANTPRKSNKAGGGRVEKFFIIMSYLLLIILFPLSLLVVFMVVHQYQRAVMFRLGRLTADSPRGPGVIFFLPCIDTYRKVDLRTVSFDVPSQELLAQTTLRSELGKRNLAELLSEREAISHTMQATLDEATDPWGIEVERVEIKDVRLPYQLQKAMAAEAEAMREARAKIIVAEGEIKASLALKEASKIMFDNPVALQLRYLQTLNTISTSPASNSTVIFPFPMEFIKAYLGGPGTSH